MKLFTQQQLQQLKNNGQRQHETNLQAEYGSVDLDFVPVVKLFNPAGGQTWLLTELDHEDPGHAFGLCDLGFGFPELGYVSLAEIQVSTPD